MVKNKIIIMDIYKLASKSKLRISTTRGVLSVEQLWDLTVSELDSLAVSLEEEVETSGRKSFLTKTTEKSKVAKLKFDIVLDILNTKVEEAEVASKYKETKENNQKILALIASKKDSELQNKSVEELEAMLK